GYLISIADTHSNTTIVSYDASDRITQVKDPALRVLTFNYQGTSSQAASISDSVGTIATYTYDAGQHLTKVVYADGGAYNINYDLNGLITSVTDADLKTIESHTYDSSLRGTSSARGAGGDALTLGYPSTGTAQLTDSLGN